MPRPRGARSRPTSPRSRARGYDGATVRHLLDMRTGVAFRETYLEPDSEVRVMERSMGWRPVSRGRPGRHVRLPDHARHRRPARRRLHLPLGRHRHARLGGRARERHAGWPTSSRACSGSRWAPSTTPTSPATRSAPPSTTAACPRRRATWRGSASCCSTTARVDGIEVVPSAWLADARHPPPDVRQAFANTDNEQVLPGGWYRNQFWFVPGPRRRRRWSAWASTARWSTSTASTRHGRREAVVVARRRRTARHLIDTLRAFGAIGASLR